MIKHMINIINDYKDAQLLPNLPLILKHLIISQLFVKDQFMLLDKNEKSTKKCHFHNVHTRFSAPYITHHEFALPKNYILVTLCLYVIYFGPNCTINSTWISILILPYRIFSVDFQ